MVVRRHRGYPPQDAPDDRRRLLRLHPYPGRNREGRGHPRPHRRFDAAGRALVVVTNKWDLVDEDRQKEIKNELERELVQIQWAPRINLAAKTGWHTNRIVRALDTALEGWETRIPTGQLNAFLGQLVAAHPHPLRGGKQPRILFGTQASSKPPRFVLFTTGFLDPGYRRFIERRLRETFGFAGTPIQISVRVREKRRR